MRIAIDAHSVGTQLAGNATYAASIIDALAAIDQKNDYTLYVTLPEAVERYAGRWPNFQARRMMAHTPIIRIPLSLSWELRRRPVDILFVQYTAPPLSPCKVVTAIHDISYEHLPETFNRRSVMQMKLTIRHTARHAAHIITPSEYSRQDIIETYKIPASKITSVPQAPAYLKKVGDPKEIARVRKRYGLPDEFILGVGSIQPRKNLVRLIEAYARLSSAGVPPLVLVGRSAWLADDTFDAVRKRNIEDRVIFTGFVPDEDLASLYSGAMFFVYPSFFEGFGLPPLEAMQCGTPVIAGNKTSIPEVVGDAGLLVDPYDIDALADAMQKLLSDDSLRNALKQKGSERVKAFSWSRTARQTLDIFERIGLE